MIALAAFLLLASGFGLLVAEGLIHRSPRTRAGLVLLCAGLVVAGLYAIG